MQQKTRCICYSQILGKIRLATTAPRNHWWNVPLYVDVRGLTTRRLDLRGGVSRWPVSNFAHLRQRYPGHSAGKREPHTIVSGDQPARHIRRWRRAQRLVKRVAAAIGEGSVAVRLAFERLQSAGTADPIGRNPTLAWEPTG